MRASAFDTHTWWSQKGWDTSVRFGKQKREIGQLDKSLFHFPSEFDFSAGFIWGRMLSILLLKTVRKRMFVYKLIRTGLGLEASKVLAWA